MKRNIGGLDPHPTPARIRELFRQKTGRELVFDVTLPRVGTAESYSAKVQPDDARADCHAFMSEHEHQVALFAWADQHTHRWRELALLFAIPNGGKRGKAVAGKLKAEGVKRGVPDICLPVPRAQFHALFVELKRIGGKPDERQLEWRAELRAQGNRAEIVEGWHAARDLLVRYLDS